MPSHRDIQCAYLQQNVDVLNAASKGSIWYSFQILRKTSFYGKLDKLKHFNEEFSRLSIPSNTQDHSLRIKELGETLEARKALYDGVGDDLLLLAAFENYMCSTLLKHGYRAPILLGGGIPLFGQLNDQIKLENSEAIAFANDFVQVKYEVNYL